MKIDYMSMPLPELVRRWSIRRDTADPSRLRAIVPTQSCADILRARKAEVLAYLAEQDALRAKENARLAHEAAVREAQLAGIEGLRELQRARQAWLDYDAAFSAAMEDEYNDNPCFPRPQYNLRALNTKYPRAAAYLLAESWSYAAHYVQAAAGSAAKEAILRGEPHDQVIAAMQAKWTAYCEEHIWD